MSGPFLKWVGGKRQLIEAISAKVPRKVTGTYWEPFLGGGALFFALAEQGRIERAVLSDANADLIDTFLAVRDAPDSLIAALRKHRNDERHFYKVRATRPDSLSPAERAARFIFLNRCGYNGLYRVNSRGEFNVPFGRYKNPRICDEDKLRAASCTLQIADIRHGDFGKISRRASESDFAYFDPPYVPLSKTASFRSYVREGFGPEDQKRLLTVAMNLKRRGVKVVLSNSYTDEVHALYSNGFTIETVHSRRSINCQPSGRAAIPEVLIH